MEQALRSKVVRDVEQLLQDNDLMHLFDEQIIEGKVSARQDGTDLISIPFSFFRWNKMIWRNRRLYQLGLFGLASPYCQPSFYLIG